MVGYLIVDATPYERGGIRYMRVTWNRPDTGEDVELIYLEGTYREQIEPRTNDVWTGGELLGLQP